jgi:hypothetical protein
VTRLWPEGEPVEVWGGEETPANFAWHGMHHRIDRTYNRWRIHTHWWLPTPAEGNGGTIQREYVKVTTSTGLLCLLYHDLSSDNWYLARVYD